MRYIFGFFISMGKTNLFKILFMVAAGAAFYVITFNIRNITPPFQGPDEIPHVAKYISFSYGMPCGNVPSSIADVYDGVSFLPFKSDEKMDMKRTDALLNVAAGQKTNASGPITYRISGYKVDGVAHSTDACVYPSFYVALPSFIDGIRDNDEIIFGNPVKYLYDIRDNISILSLMLWMSNLALVLWGNVLFKVDSFSAAAIRFAGLLSVTYMMFIPQTTWVSSIVGQDYLLVSLGSFVALSGFFRINYLSDILLAASIYTAAGKVVYVIPFMGMVVFHYLCFLSGFLKPETMDRIRGFVLGKKMMITAAVVFLMLVSYVAARKIISDHCLTSHCRAVMASGFFTDPGLFLKQLYIMVFEKDVLSLPVKFHKDSAFGAFGWLDSIMPRRSMRNYTYPVMAALIMGFIFSGVYSMFYFKKKNYLRRREKFVNDSIRVFIVFLAYWGLSLLALYFIMVLMEDWCMRQFGQTFFGCAYQRRYGLPLYHIIPFISFYLLFRADLLFESSGGKIIAQRVLFVCFLFWQSYVIFNSYNAQMNTLEERYFVGQSEKDDYVNKLLAVVK